MTFLFIMALLGCVILGILYLIEKAENESLSFRLSQEEQSKESSQAAEHSATIAKLNAEMEANAAKEELENRIDSLKRNIQSLRDRLKHRLLQKHDSPGNIVDCEFKKWLADWEENGGEGPSNSFLETADDLFSRLEQLPDDCDDFVVRFKAEQGRRWIQPTEWHIHDDNDLVLKDSEDVDDPFTVQSLKDILNGQMDNDDQRVCSDTRIFLDIPDKDGDSVWFRPLDDQFSINRDKDLVVVKMGEA